LRSAALEQAVQPELDVALAKVTPATHWTQTAAAAPDEKPAGHGEHAVSPEAA